MHLVRSRHLVFILAAWYAAAGVLAHWGHQHHHSAAHVPGPGEEHAVCGGSDEGALQIHVGHCRAQHSRDEHHHGRAGQVLHHHGSSCSAEHRADGRNATPHPQRDPGHDHHDDCQACQFLACVSTPAGLLIDLPLADHVERVWIFYESQTPAGAAASYHSRAPPLG